MGEYNDRPTALFGYVPTFDPADYSEFIQEDSESPNFDEFTTFNDSPDAASPSTAFAASTQQPSPNSSGASQSDGSSKRAGVTSSRTSVQGDVSATIDQPTIKPDWTSNLNMTAMGGGGGSGDINSIESMAQFSYNSPESAADLNSAGNAFAMPREHPAQLNTQPFAPNPATAAPFMFVGAGPFSAPGNQFMPGAGPMPNMTPDLSPIMGDCLRGGPQAVFSFPSGLAQTEAWAQNYGRPGMPQHRAVHGLPNNAPPDILTFDATFLSNEPTSRVETQRDIMLKLSHLPLGVKKLHLPTHTISKPKQLAKPTPPPSEEMLELHLSVVCTSAMQDPNKKAAAQRRAAETASRGRPPSTMSGSTNTPPATPQDVQLTPQDGGEVTICDNCQKREKKRAGRKKLKKAMDEEELWQQNESRRVVVFNTHEVQVWGDSAQQTDVPLSRGAKTRQLSRPAPQENQFQDHHAQGYQIILPMRIACYCRHHAEKTGFQVIFTLTNNKFNVVAQAMLPNLYITDNHKDKDKVSGSSLSRPAPKRSLSGVAVGQTPFPEQAQPSTAVSTPPGISRPASPCEDGPSAKKRKASMGKISTPLAMSPLDPAQQLQPQLPPTPMVSASTSPTTFASSMNFIDQTGFVRPDVNMIANPTSNEILGSLPNGSTPSHGRQQQVASPSARSPPGYGDMDLAFYSAPGSTRQSRAPSPHTLRATPETSSPDPMPDFNGLALTHPSPGRGLLLTPPSFEQGLAQVAGDTGLHLPSPMVLKLAPGEGSKMGGTEVMIVGSNFHRGLEVYFGDKRAVTSTFWTDACLEVRVPPAAQEGWVPVTLKHGQMPLYQEKLQFFRYTGNSELENHLMRTALTLFGQKTGQFASPDEIAKRMVSPQFDWQSVLGPKPTTEPGRGASDNLEMQLLSIMFGTRRHQAANLNLRRSKGGHSMLHLASALGFVHFAKGLLHLKAHVDIRDLGGYTPLHLAALHNNLEMVKALLAAKADPSLRSLSGSTAADLASSEDVLRALGGSVEEPTLARRTASSSAISGLANARFAPQALRSLVPSTPPRLSSEEPTSDEESLESSSVPDSSEDESSLSMSNDRLANAPPRQSRSSSRVRERDINGPRDVLLGSPAATMAVVRDQFAIRLQQAQALLQQLQTLSPNIPNMPYMPPVASIFSGPRFGPAREDDMGWREMWERWKLSSSSPPPSYEEVCPPDSRDAAETKEASAARAALDAEGDAKCAALFDTPQAEVESTASSSPALSATEENSELTEDDNLPPLLQIGRKNAITKEQQENLRRAHAEKLKRLSRDRNLFFIWIPLLLIVMFAMLYNRVPVLLSSAKETFWATLNNAQEELQQVLRPSFTQGTVR